MLRSKRLINSKNKSKKNHNRNCATNCGLHKWYHELFEKLGWMVLANNKGHHDKIICYKKSLYRLKESIEYKINNIHDPDRKQDLQIMWYNLNMLISHVEKDFK